MSIFTNAELDCLPMSDLVLMAGGDWDTYDNDDKEDESYIEAVSMANRISEIEVEISHLDALFDICSDKGMVDRYNSLNAELKQLRMHVNGY